MTTASSHPTDGLLALVYGELSPAEARTVQAHVDGCAACTATVAGYRRVRSAASSLPRELPSPSGLESVLHYGERAAARARVRRRLSRVWPLAAGALAVWVGVVALRPPAGKVAADALAVGEPRASGPSVAPASPPAEDEASRVANRAAAPEPVARAGSGKTLGVVRTPEAPKGKSVPVPAAPTADKVAEAPAKGGQRVATAAPLIAPEADARLRSEEAAQERKDAPLQTEAWVAAAAQGPDRDAAAASADVNLAKKSVAASPPLAKSEAAPPVVAGAGALAPARSASVAAAFIAPVDGGVSAPGGADEARRAALHVRLRETQGAQQLPLLAELCGLEARLGHVKDAVGFCQRVVREYPGTPEAAAAQRQIELLRGGG